MEDFGVQIHLPCRLDGKIDAGAIPTEDRELLLARLRVADEEAAIELSGLVTAEGFNVEV